MEHVDVPPTLRDALGEVALRLAELGEDENLLVRVVFEDHIEVPEERLGFAVDLDVVEELHKPCELGSLGRVSGRCGAHNI